MRAAHGLYAEYVELPFGWRLIPCGHDGQRRLCGPAETTRHVELIGTNAAVSSKATTGIDMLAAATPCSGRSRLYLVTGGLRSAYDLGEIEEQVAIRQNATAIVLQQDLPILKNIRLRPQRATKSDRATHDFLWFAAA